MCSTVSCVWRCINVYSQHTLYRLVCLFIHCEPKNTFTGVYYSVVCNFLLKWTKAMSYYWIHIQDVLNCKLWLVMYKRLQKILFTSAYYDTVVNVCFKQCMIAMWTRMQQEILVDNRPLLSNIYILLLTGKPGQQWFTIPSDVLTSISSRQHGAISGHPLLDWMNLHELDIKFFLRICYLFKAVYIDKVLFFLEQCWMSDPTVNIDVNLSQVGR